MIFFLTFLSLIHHQVLTKNQEFIFFLIPLFSAFLQIELHDLKHKFKKYLIYLTLAICLFATFKYHLRFNLGKKFHELSDINFENSIKGSTLDKKFEGLNWITPGKNKKKDVEKEMILIKEIMLILRNDNQKKMLFTEKMNSPSRWFPGDDSAFPKKENSFYNEYKLFLANHIKNNSIINIYVISDVSEENLLDYIPLECFNKTKPHNDLVKFEINSKCKNLYRN